MSTKTEHPMSQLQVTMQPVTGLIIPRSVGKSLGWMLLAVLAFPMGCLLTWGKIRNVLFDEFPGGNEVTLYGFVLGLVLIAASPIMVYQLARSILVRRKLVIGQDRLQIQERRGENDVAVLQIPFANIAEVQYEVTLTDRQVSIDLNNPDDPETCGERNDFRANKNVLGRHYCITEAFQMGASEIAAEIQRAMTEWAAVGSRIKN